MSTQDSARSSLQLSHVDACVMFARIVCPDKMTSAPQSM